MIMIIIIIAPEKMRMKMSGKFIRVLVESLPVSYK